MPIGRTWGRRLGVVATSNLLEPVRPRLVGVAYRMLDKVSAAFEDRKPHLMFTTPSDVEEDVLHEAFAE